MKLAQRGAVLAGVFLALASCSSSEDVAKRELASGLRHLESRQYEPALAAFDRVLALAPTHREARRCKAEILFNTDRFDAAAAILTALRREWPEDAGVVIDLARVRKDQGRFHESIRLFDLLDEASRPKLAWAEALTGVDRHKDAARVVAEVLAVDPWHPNAYYLLSRIDTRRGRTVAAETWAEVHRARGKFAATELTVRQLELQGRHVPAMMRRAAGLQRAGRWHPAALLVQKVLTADSKQTPAYILMGSTLSHLGRATLATKAFEQAAALDPSNAAIRQRLAQERARVQPDEAATSPLTIARHRAKAGELDLARAIALYMAERNPKGPEALRLVVELFDRPIDAFLRLWALRQLVTLQPEDRGLAVRNRTEWEQLEL